MIRINEDYVIAPDYYSFILKKDLHREEKQKNGKTAHAYKVMGYYSTILGALDGLAKEMTLEMISAEDLNLVEAIERIREIYKGIEDSFKREVAHE